VSVLKPDFTLVTGEPSGTPYLDWSFTPQPALHNAGHYLDETFTQRVAGTIDPP
jgi:hypothetical protein